MPADIFVLPVVGSGTNDDPFRPKYLYESDGAGGVQLRPEVDAYHGTEEFSRDGSDYMAVLVEATQSSLDLLTSQSDAYVIDPVELATALNTTDTFPVDLDPHIWGLVLSRVLALAGIE